MQYNFSNLKTKVKDTEEWLKRENAQIRTGRASINLLDMIMVESYGAQLPINQIASLTTEDARTIRVSPWDLSLVKEIEKAVTKSNLGVSVTVDDKGLRISFPALTTERRAQVAKVAKEKLEQARISLRKLRDETWDDIQKKEKEGGMGEDEKFRFKADMEKIIQEAGKNLEVLYQKKEEEILN